MIKCCVCGQEVTSKRGLAFHIKKHDIKSVQDYIKMFPEQEQLVDPKDTDLLQCPICGQKNLKQLTQHITWKHKLSRTEFKKLYPNQTLFIEEISERCKQATKLGHEKYLENVKNDPEKYKNSYMERSKKRLQNNPDIGIKISKILRENGTYDATSTRTKKMWQDESYRKMQSDKCKEQHKNGLTEIVVQKSCNKNYIKIATFNNKQFRFRSSYELQFAEILNSYGIDFEYESLKLTYFYNGSFHTYYPDFVIPNTNIIFEVKPYFRITDIRNQIKQRTSIEKGYSFRYITEYELENPETINFKGCF
jgi:hypothetical protein